MKYSTNRNLFKGHMLELLLTLLFTTGTLLSGCNPKSESIIRKSESLAMCSIVDSLTNRLAVAISNRDAKAVAENVPCDDRIVYVSNGVPIRGNEYIEILSNYYQHLDSLSFIWEKKEFSFLVPNTVVMVGWAKISAFEKGIGEKKDKAVFSFVYHRDGSIWRMAFAHKESI